jgi:type IV pilus assembly protein PilN
MHLNINLATRTYVNSNRLNTVFAALFVVLLLLLLLEIRTVASTTGEIVRINGEIAEMERKNAGGARKVTEQEYQKLLTQIRYANAMILRKSFNWIALLDNLESVVPDGVAITQIEPDPKTKGLKVTGATLSFSRLRTMLENMENSSSFSDIYLLSQAQAKVGESQKGLTFSVNCQVKL